MNTNAPCISARSFARLAAVVASIALSGYAEAGDQTVSVSETVSTVGIDLNTPEGARKAYIRLKIASRRVCGDSRLGLELPQVGCAEDALGNAIRSVNRPQLTMVYLRSHSIQTAEAHGIRIPILVADK
jgi:UrcA family protein